MTMKILLTNDDGVYSLGIQTLARKLTEKGHEVLVVAPDRERSGCGHAMTLDRPLNLQKVDSFLLGSTYTTYSCDGTPTDCVILALDALKFIPDFIFSGINQGLNLGDDLTYSGTACAAMEGVLYGFPSIAISLAANLKCQNIYNYTAAEVAIAILDWLELHPLPEGVMLNVNIPNLPLKELKGVSLTRTGKRLYKDKVRVVEAPTGEKAYWIGGTAENDLTHGTDVWAVFNGYASITPVHLDMTCYKTYDECDGLGAERALVDQLNKIIHN